MRSERWLLLAGFACGCVYDWDALRYDPDAAVLPDRATPDAAPDRVTPDAAPDARADRESPDAAPDAPGPDVRDATPDAPVDVSVDAPRDAGPDALDASPDAAPDVPRDVGLDAAPDATPDATPDVAPDLPPACTPAGMTCPCAPGNLDGYCRPGEACTGGRCVMGTIAGSLVLTEIMNNPAVPVTDELGEWFEVFNPGMTPLDLRGVRVTSANDTGSFTVTPPAGAPLVIPSRGYLVFGRSDVMSMNGQVPVRYAYGSLVSFNNSGADSVVLDLGSAATEIDRVAFDSSTSGGWPRMEGRAKSLRPERTSAMENDDRTNWCDAPMQWAGAGDYGSPGAANPACP